MDIDIGMWRLLCLPIFVFGLCLSINFSCFTKHNVAAWAASLIFCYSAATLAAKLYPDLQDSVWYCLAYTDIATVFMLYYFYGMRKNTPLSESISFCMLAVASYSLIPMAGFIILLWGLFQFLKNMSAETRMDLWHASLISLVGVFIDAIFFSRIIG